MQFQVQFKGDQILLIDAGSEEAGTRFVKDPKAKPKAMDLIPKDGPGKGKTLPLAIYNLDGDKLTCLVANDGIRPKPADVPWHHCAKQTACDFEMRRGG